MENLKYPINTTLGLTMECNIRCPYCLHGPDRGDKTMSEEVINASIEAILKNRKIRNTPDNTPSLVNFSGGEPLLKKDLIVKTFEKYPRDKYPFMDWEITTNGKLLLDEPFIEKCREAGAYFIVSYDGILSTSPKGGTGTTRDGLEFLRDMKYPRYGISFVSIEQEVEDLVHNLVDLARNSDRDLDVPALLNCVIPRGPQETVREVEEDFLEKLQIARNTICDMNPSFIFLAHRPVFETPVIGHGIRADWGYFIHPTGKIMYDGIKSFGTDNIDERMLMGDILKSSEITFPFPTDLTERCTLCNMKDKPQRCHQEVFCGESIPLCRTCHVFGEDMLALTEEYESWKAFGAANPMKKRPIVKAPDHLYVENGPELRALVAERKGKNVTP